MSIAPFLRDQAFNPEQIEIMAAAFQDASIALGLADRTDAVTEIIASHIIKLAQQGISTRAELYQGAIEGCGLIKQPDKSAPISRPADQR